MKGTEKQIKWATEIKECVISILEDTIKVEPNSKPILNKIIAKLNDDNVYAGDIIDLFKDVQKYAPERKTTIEKFSLIMSELKLTTNPEWNIRNFR